MRTAFYNADDYRRAETENSMNGARKLDEMRATDANLVRLELRDGPICGHFVAPVMQVARLLEDAGIAALRRQCMDYWPELFKTTDDRAHLRALPAFVLAVAICQL